MLLMILLTYGSFILLLPVSKANEIVDEGKCHLINYSLICEFFEGKLLPPYDYSTINSFTIQHSDITSLTTKDFSSFTNVNNISISNSSLVFPSQELLFANVENLTVLEIMNSGLGEDIFKTFANNSEIIRLKLSGNKIAAIRKTFLSKLYLIQEIDLSDNIIEYIEENTFQKLLTLKKLNLSRNRIGKLFDTTYVSIASTVCAVCKPDDNIKTCTSFDLFNCKVNHEIDQLWWISHAVNIRLHSNPICSAISGVSNITKSSNQHQNQIPKDSTEVNKTCRVYEYGYCFKHESRRMFLLEVCGAPKIFPSPIFRRRVETLTQNSRVADGDVEENVDLETMLLSAGFPTLFIAGTCIVVLAAILGSLLTLHELKKTARSKVPKCASEQRSFREQEETSFTI